MKKAFNSLQSNGVISIHPLAPQYNKSLSIFNLVNIPSSRFPSKKQEYEHKLFDPPSDKFRFDKVLSPINLVPKMENRN